MTKTATKTTPNDGLSPAMRQYVEMKAVHPEGILFFQMGDFYEMFFEDAEKAAALLDIALTSRSKRGDTPIPMCGVPLSAGLMYANRLTRQGLQVVLANQVGDAAAAKGIVERAIVRVGTPGVPLEDDSAAAGEPHYLASIFPGPGGYGLASLEVSTGDLLLARFGDLESLRAEFLSLSPHECLLPQRPAPELMEILNDMRVYATHLPPEKMDALTALDRFRELFGAHALASWELDKWPEALSAAGAVLDYAESCSQSGLAHLAPPRLLWNQSHLVLDEAALANLEILKTLRHGQLEGSLLGLMDKTATPMGSRLLRQWLSRPLRDAAEISARHSAVEEFLRDGLSRDALAGLLKRTSDLERALGRVILKRGGPRDMAALRDTLALTPEYKGILSGMNTERKQISSDSAEAYGHQDSHDGVRPLRGSARLAALGDALPDFSELTATLMSHLEENPPASAKDGGFIKRGVSADLDELLDLEKGGKSGILALEAREKERTGINSLKVGFNRVYGYYLEVTKSNLANVPDEWIRKQTIAGGERYLTPELKEWEEKILHAGERRLALEEQMFEELKEKISASARPIKEAAQILAEADVLAAFAAGAEKYGWVRPELTDEDLIDVKGGRHPVVEALLPPGEPFVANDVRLTTRERLLVITGPNMAGKSTILRQVALIVLMNQAGSFIPAESARLSIRDRIFTRVGAADDLARGRSTFMVEMNETARILTMATPRSLVVLDEVGRGTSTYDGLSLAWAIAEYLHDLDGDGVPTLFATHYHELIDLADTKPRVRNFNVAIKNTGSRITFMRELKPGGVSRSYGLAVAAMAGLPKKVLERAKEVMADFSRAGDHVIRPAIRQLGLFDAPEAEPEEAPGPELPELVKAVAGLKPESMTPLEALNLLNSLAAEARRLIEENEG